MVEISIVIPAYNEEKNIGLLYNKLKEVLSKISKTYEIIFVDDGSIDKTFEELKKRYEKDKHIKIIRLQKNFGKSTALTLGFKEATGNLIFTMDADLQDDPKEIPKFISEINKGYDLISGCRCKREDSISKKIPSKFFNWLTAKITGVKIHDSNCGFKCYKKEVVKNIEIYGELHRYIPSLAYWKGFRVGEIRVTHHSRKYGKSRYGVFRLFRGFFDLITINFLEIYEERPMHLFGVLGLIFFIGGFLLGLYILYIKLILKQQLGLGRPIVTLTALLIIAGIQLISIGLIGELIVRKSVSEEKVKRLNKKYVKKVYLR